MCMVASKSKAPRNKWEHRNRTNIVMRADWREIKSNDYHIFENTLCWDQFLYSRTLSLEERIIKIVYSDSYTPNRFVYIHDTSKFHDGNVMCRVHGTKKATDNEIWLQMKFPKRQDQVSLLWCMFVCVCVQSNTQFFFIRLELLLPTHASPSDDFCYWSKKKLEIEICHWNCTKQVISLELTGKNFNIIR